MPCEDVQFDRTVQDGNILRQKLAEAFICTECMPFIDRRSFNAGIASAIIAAKTAAFARDPSSVSEWTKLPTDPYLRKQDDIFFIDPQIGWYGNGDGRLYKTTDGGTSWIKVFEEPGTFIRALGFSDAKTGVMGNVGTGYFPGVSDETALYRTIDGGASWQAVAAIDGPKPKGICAIDVLRSPFINSGVLDYRITIRAGGRVGGPAVLLSSTDLGVSWRSMDLTTKTEMILDVHFVDELTGFIAGASDADVERSNAVVLKTSDGGKTWRRVYQSKRSWEITWKLAFPTKSVGYVTVQSYDPDASKKTRYIAKTIDGGETWQEVPIAVDTKFTELGVAFIDERRGWVGSMQFGLETRDGGAHWRRVGFGEAVNKIRVVRAKDRARIYAIGKDIYALDLPSPFAR